MADPTFAGDPGGMVRVGWRIRGIADGLITTGRAVQATDLANARAV